MFCRVVSFLVCSFGYIESHRLWCTAFVVCCYYDVILGRVRVNRDKKLEKRSMKEGGEWGMKNVFRGCACVY